MDPVFLIDKDVYLNVAKQSKLNIPFEYILVYILDATPQKVEIVKKYEKLYGLKKFIILDLAKYNKNVNSFSEDVLGKLPFEDFIYYFINAKFIITDSFHGTCFSLIFNKQFVSIKNRNRKRFDTLQDLFKNQVTFMPIYDHLKDIRVEKNTIDYTTINTILDECCTKSNLLLKQALSSHNYEESQNGDDSVEMNIQYIKLWRNYYNIQKQLSKEKESVINMDNSSLTDLNYSCLWKTVSEKLVKVVPSVLLSSTEYSKNYYKIYIKGINRSIHYEFLVKDSKAYFCLHCENKQLEKFCRHVFENVKKVWNVETPKSLYKLNKPIQDIRLFDIEAFDYIGKSQPFLKELYDIEQLKE